MNRMKKRTMFAINMGVWLAALTSAAAVALAATRPASLPTTASDRDSQTATECAAVAPSVSVSQPTVFMPDDTIVGARPAPEGP
jgi:hypothetical protein